MLMISFERIIGRNRIRIDGVESPEGSILFPLLLGFDLFTGNSVFLAGPAAQIDEPALLGAEGPMRIALPLRPGAASGTADLENFYFFSHGVIPISKCVRFLAYLITAVQSPFQIFPSSRATRRRFLSGSLFSEPARTRLLSNLRNLTKIHTRLRSIL